MRGLWDKILKGGYSLAVAESCTGGLLASRITDVPGSSRYFIGGIVAYSNEVKIKILGVHRETIERHGAVSEECAREMALGVAHLLNADLAISTTGIAGPTGGTEEKPVGTVYIGIFHRGKLRVEKRRFEGTREEIKEKIVSEALKLLYEMI